MADESFFSRMGEKLSEQQWWQELKAKWEELDDQSRLYLKIAGVAVVVGTVTIVSLRAVWSVYSLRDQLTDTMELLDFVEAANEESSEIRGNAPRVPGGSKEGSWNDYIGSIATRAGIPGDSLEVSRPSKGKADDTSEESLMNVTARKINIKQVVRLAFQLENGGRPLKVRNLSINTTDAEGHLDAILAVSGFELLEEKK